MLASIACGVEAVISIAFAIGMRNTKAILRTIPMPDVEAALEHCKWLIAHGRAKEPAKLVLPKIEAQRRRVNKEKRTRVQFDTDPQFYADWHADRTRYVEACRGHVPIADAIRLRVTQQVPSELIAKMYEAELAEDAEKPDRAE